MVGWLSSFRLGWFGAVLLGQQLGWASGESTCTSITVSGVGDYDGKYDLTSTKTFRRAGGTTVYYLSQAIDFWLLEGSSPEYKTFDDAVHPADITLEWAECTSFSRCDAGAASLQPVITCEEDGTTTSDDDSATTNPTTEVEETDGEATEPPSSAGSPSTPSPETSVEGETAAPTPWADVSQGEADGEGLSVGGIAGIILGIIVVEIVVL